MRLKVMNSEKTLEEEFDRLEPLVRNCDELEKEVANELYALYIRPDYNVVKLCKDFDISYKHLIALFERNKIQWWKREIR